MLFKITDHLEKLAKKSQAVRRQFYPSSLEEEDAVNSLDPLLEEEHTKVRGLVHKYKNRVLLLLTLNCEAYCRFCTRRRSVSDVKGGVISPNDLENIIDYLKAHKEIKEVIISGGDPLTVPEILEKTLKEITKLPQIKIIRIGTRLPVSNPPKIDAKLLKILSIVKKQPLYILIHFEHPDEITKETKEAVYKLRKAGAILFSQSVFLKGVNDSFETLYKLFSGLVEIGVKPYYLYRCDLVKGTYHFIVPFEKEVEIATKLRKNLSGLACPIYVIDTPNGSGKIPPPLLFWKTETSSFTDFEGNKIGIK